MWRAEVRKDSQTRVWRLNGPQRRYEGGSTRRRRLGTRIWAANVTATRRTERWHHASRLGEQSSGANRSRVEYPNEGERSGNRRRRCDWVRSGRRRARVHLLFFGVLLPCRRSYDVPSRRRNVGGVCCRLPAWLLLLILVIAQDVRGAVQTCHGRPPVARTQPVHIHSSVRECCTDVQLLRSRRWPRRKPFSAVCYAKGEATCLAPRKSRRP